MHDVVRIVTCVCLLVWAQGSSAAAPPGSAQESDRQEIIALEKAWADAAPARDLAVYERVLAEDFIGQWAEGS